MTYTDLRTRTASDIVDAAFALYRRHRGAYVLVVALAQAPTLVLQIVLQGVRAPDSMPSLNENVFVLLVSVVPLSFMSGMLILMGSQAYLGGQPDTAAAVEMVLARFGRLLPASLMLWILYFIGVLGLFVGVLYVGARFFAVEAVVVLENRKVGGAFGRSSDLSDGQKRHVLNTLVLMYTIYLLLMFGASWIAGFAGSQIVSLIVTKAVTVVVYPVIGLTTVVLYYDLRIRSEGFDLEQMQRALESPAGGLATDA